MSIVSIANSRFPAAPARQESSRTPKPVPRLQTYVHEEVVGLLVLQLLDGHAAEIIPVIDRLQRELRVRGARSECNDLRVLRQLAELDVDGDFDAVEASSETPVRLALQFGLRIMPTLRWLAVSDCTPALSNRLRTVITADLTNYRPRTLERSAALSRRELQTLSLASLGLTNLEIAQRMNIREGTVKKHLSNVFTKLDVTNRTQAVNKARQFGLL